jgi:hypothetical protein
VAEDVEAKRVQKRQFQGGFDRVQPKPAAAGKKGNSLMRKEE